MPIIQNTYNTKAAKDNKLALNLRQASSPTAPRSLQVTPMHEANGFLIENHANPSK